jgi:hypothetical protein
MAKVRVQNLDHREYTEEFRDELIVIPPGGYVEMGRSEAVAFLGQMTPLNVDGAGRITKPKKLKIVEDPEEFAAARDQPFRYESPDGKRFRSEQGYNEYMARLEAEARTITSGDNDGPKRRRQAPKSAEANAT